MNFRTSQERLVLRAVHDLGVLTMDQAVRTLPELSWNEIFQAVDALSRRGAICVRRCGFEYVLRAR
jgi:hypothetical protein